MSKEKKRIETEHEKIYYYEISATIVILFCLITFSELGFVGMGLKSLLKILLGDFYFILIIYLIINGIRALVKKKWFDLTSIKFNGFIIFFLSLITINHLGFYERLGFSNNEIFTKSITTYSNVLKNLIHINSFGGGLIGALLCQLLIFLFNDLGTIVILIVLMILSLSFMTSMSYKTILYYINLVIKKSRTVCMLIYKYFNNISLPTKTIKKSKLNININMLDDIDNSANQMIVEKLCIEDKVKIQRLYKEKYNFDISVEVEVGYLSTRFTINQKLYNKDDIRNIINSNVIFYEYSSFYTIECLNKVKRLLTVKNILLETNSIPIGREINNNIIIFDNIKHKNLLLTGGYSCGIKTFIKSFIISSIFKYKYSFKLAILDIKHDFLELKYLPNLFIPFVNNKNDIVSSLDLLAKELERRMDIINDKCYENYLEHNIKEDKLDEIFVIINSIDEFKKEKQLNENKLLYFLKFGYKVGIHFIVINREYGVEKEVLVNIQTKLVFKCYNNGQSYEVLNNSNACLLDQQGDIIMTYLNEIHRISTPYISNKDYDKIINKFIVN